jgi:ubiquinone/menaquinone biosynthesis C-methylase UbiE
MNNEIRFDDGAAYERYMGVWSRLAGEIFLDWLELGPRLRWLDVGCGSGAFTAVIAQRHAPASVQGIDPSEAMLAYARAQPAAPVIEFRQGDAMALPFADDSFDVAVMALVIFFVPQPSVGVAEMGRVVRPGGTVAAYAWDMVGGGFPYDALHAEMRAMGVAVPVPPSPEASRIEALRDLWAAAGLEAVTTRAIEVQRSFAGFDEYWATVRGGPSIAARLAATPAAALAQLRERMRARLPMDAAGRITVSARAHAVKGRVAA